MKPQPALCIECGKYPQAPNGWTLCWACEAEWDAHRTETAARNALDRAARLREYAASIRRAQEERVAE